MRQTRGSEVRHGSRGAAPLLGGSAPDVDTTGSGALNAADSAAETSLRAGTDIGDPALLRRVRDGDLGAFTPLYARYKNVVLGALRKKIRNDAVCEDLAQIVFQRFWEKSGKLCSEVERFTGDRPFSAWLYKVATNAAVDWLRKENRLPIAVDEDPTEEGTGSNLVERLPDDRSSSEELAEQRARDVWDCLEQLPEKLRDVFRLHLEGKIYEQIAELCGISITTVSNRITKVARPQLKLCLEQKNYRVMKSKAN